MPIPLFLAGAALVAGAFGLKKGADAYSDNQEAEEALERAQEIYEEAKADMEAARDTCSDHLAQLGKLKLEVWDRQLGRFVALVEQVENVELEGEVQQDLGLQARVSNDELLHMKDMSLKAAEVVAGGVQALGAGALAGVASYGGAMMLATASTGTAISTLSGVAATNATLAWFGGGSLAAGGMGMAGGAAVLGGLVAGPVLAIGGMFMAAKARENLAEAKKTLAEAKKAAEELKDAEAMMQAITVISDQVQATLKALDKRMTVVLDELERQLALAKANNNSLLFKLKKFLLGLVGKEVPLQYKDLEVDQRKAVHLAYLFAQATKLVLETPLLTQDGALDEKCIKAIEPAKQLLG